MFMTAHTPGDRYLPLFEVRKRAILLIELTDQLFQSRMRWNNLEYILDVALISVIYQNIDYRSSLYDAPGINILSTIFPRYLPAS